MFNKNVNMNHFVVHSLVESSSNQDPATKKYSNTRKVKK